MSMGWCVIVLEAVVLGLVPKVVVDCLGTESGTSYSCVSSLAYLIVTSLMSENTSGSLVMSRMIIIKGRILKIGVL